MTTALQIQNLNFAYGRTRVLHDVGFHAAAGEIVTIIGPNGAGKSTLLNVVARSHKMRSGTVKINGQDTGHMTQAAVVKHGCVLVPEGRQVFSSLSVHDNLILGGYTARHQRKSKGPLDRIYEIFPRLQERREQLAGTLSGGEQQMLAIGRAIMSEPSVMLLDEPSLGLAPQITARIMDILAELRNSNGLTIILVEQNAHAALNLADRGYVLNGGRIVLEGSSRELRADKTIQHIYLGASPDSELVGSADAQ